MSNNTNYIPAVIPAGNVKAKINSIELKDKPWKSKEGLTITDVILNLETEPMGGNFKGLKKDYNNPNSDTYLGQVAKVRLSEWGFKDVNLPDFQITREADILRALKSLFMETGTLEWFKAQDNKFDTQDIQRLIDLFNKEQPMKNFYMYWCLASRQYINRNGYKTDDLYLPKWTKADGSPFSTKLDSLIKFDITKHVTPPKTKEVSSFGENTAASPVSNEVKSTDTQHGPSAGTNQSSKESVSEIKSSTDLIWEQKAEEILKETGTDKAYEEFMKAGKQNNPVSDQNQVDPAGTGIVTDNNPVKLPWE